MSTQLAGTFEWANTISTYQSVSSKGIAAFVLIATHAGDRRNWKNWLCRSLSKVLDKNERGDVWELIDSFDSTNGSTCSRAAGSPVQNAREWCFVEPPPFSALSVSLDSLQQSEHFVMVISRRPMAGVRFTKDAADDVGRDLCECYTVRNVVLSVTGI